MVPYPSGMWPPDGSSLASPRRIRDVSQPSPFKGENGEEAFVLLLLLLVFSIRRLLIVFSMALVLLF